jgi:transmembrane sensor
MMGEELSPEDKAYLDLWINKNEQNRKEFELLTGLAYKVRLSDSQSYKSIIFSKINKRITQQNTKVRNLWFASSIAASIVISFFIGGYSWNYLPVGNNLSNKVVYNEVIVPEGAKTQLTLSDGTKVWLNGGSKLRYPANFITKIREVQLEGEAFFDVSENKSKPFIVRTTDVQIKVLGTAFNVKSYAGDKTIETTLIRGLVEIREIKSHSLSEPLLIKPNQQATFIKEYRNLKIKDKNPRQTLKDLPEKLPSIKINQVNTLPIISWKEKTLVFDNSTLEEIAVNLERWYGIKIHILNNDLKKFKYKGRFNHNETIYQVLEVIKVTTPIKYEIKNYEININLQNK